MPCLAIKKKYNQSIFKIRKFINYLKNDHNDFYDNLKVVACNSSRGDKSPHNSLSMFINECQIILSDESNSLVDLKQEDFEDKINILKNILSQRFKSIDEISKIDLRYSGHNHVFFQLNKEDVDG